MEPHMRFNKALLAAGVALALAACSDNPPAEMPAAPPASNEVPAGATASVASYVQYVGSLAKTETGQPLDVNKVVPPISETDLPVPVT
jgi:hypothetical protein